MIHVFVEIRNLIRSLKRMRTGAVVEAEKADNTKAEYSYDDAVELAGHGRYNRLALAACSAISLAVALDMFGFGVVLAAAACDLRLGVAQLGLLASTPFAGLLFAFPWGYYADTRGRRRALLLSCTVGFVLAALGSLSPSWHVLLILKLVGCCFSTAAYSLTVAYLGECTGERRCSRYLFIMNSVNLFSEAVTFIMAYLILPLTFTVGVPGLRLALRPWRLLALLLALPLGIGALLMSLLHESPKFLANNGQAQEALEVLKKIFVVNGGKNGEYQVKTLKTITLEAQSKQYFWESVRKQTVPIFKPPLLWKTLQLFYLLVICCSTNNVFVMWYPTMVNSFFASIAAGAAEQTFCHRVVGNISVVKDQPGDLCDDTLSYNTIYSGIVYGCFFTGANLAAATLARRRRALLLAVLGVSAACAAFIDLPKEPYSGMVMFTLLQGTSIGIGAVTSYFVDLYPTSYRGLVTSVGMMTARLGSCAGVNAVGAALVASCGATFYFWAALVFSAIPVAMLLPSDTSK